MKKKQNTILYASIAMFISAILVVADQLTKYWALHNLKSQGSIVIFSDILNFTYLENTGAAFGILQGKTILLGVVSGVLILSIIIAMFVGKMHSVFLKATFSIIIAGGIGNVIDRFLCGYVVDFIDLRFPPFTSFPIFNLADIYVTVGSILLVIYILFMEPKKKPTKE